MSLGERRLRQSNDEIRAAFCLFDMHDTGVIPLVELPLLLYALGVDATTDDVVTHMEFLFGETMPAVNAQDFRKLVESMAVTPDSEEEALMVFDLLLKTEREPLQSTTVQMKASSSEDEEMPRVLLPHHVTQFLRSGAPFLREQDSQCSLERLHEQLDVDKDGVISRRDWIDALERASLIRSKTQQRVPTTLRK